MIVLYGPAQAPYTEKVRRALLYKRLEFAFEQPESEDDYRRWSPKTGMLPVLDLDGEHVPDSTAILYRLEEVYPDPPLLSPAPTVAAQQRQLLEWADQSFLWHYSRYRKLVEGAVTLPTTETQRQPLPSDEDWGPLRRAIDWLRNGGTWERPRTSLLRDLGLRLDDLVRFLGSRPYFYAQQLSVADLGVYGMLHTMRNDSIPGSAAVLAERAALLDFMRRVEDATDT